VAPPDSSRGIASLLPRYDVHEVHRRVYDAPPAAVREAVESVTASDLPLTRLLFAVRLLPALLAGRRVRDGGTLTDGLVANGFARVVDTPDEVVYAVVGQFWRPGGGRERTISDAAAFTAFDEPGYAKAAMSFELTPCDGGTELLTETRVLTTSAGARRAFAAYWLVVGTGSALIRSELLAAVARRLSRERATR